MSRTERKKTCRTRDIKDIPSEINGCNPSIKDFSGGIPCLIIILLPFPSCFSQALEGEVCRLSQSLESSLLEKGEIASRLNSTQDEVQQMRTGIEKLQVRIESDERKKKKMGELLKGNS